MATKKIVAKKPVRKVVTAKVEKNQPVELKKLVVKIHGKELELTPQEAKELKEILNALFEESEKIEKVVVQPYPYPVPYPYKEIIYIKPWEWHYTYPWITYNGTVSTATGNITTNTAISDGKNCTWTCNCANNGIFTCACG